MGVFPLFILLKKALNLQCNYLTNYKTYKKSFFYAKQVRKGFHFVKSLFLNNRDC